MEKHPKAFSQQEADNRAESCKRSQQNSSMGLERWQDLDTNILKEIFSRIPLHDVILNTCLVCRSWRSASWDLFFWSRKVLDLGLSIAASKNFSFVQPMDCLPSHASAFQYDQIAGKLIKQLMQIMVGNDAYGYSLEDWRRSIHTIIIPCDLELMDAHLLYIAERTPGAKHLSLLGTHKITAEGFWKVIQNWKFLKSIHLGKILGDNWFSQIIEEKGRNCEEVEELYIHEAMLMIGRTKPVMFDIVNNLPGLKVIGFETALAYNSWIFDFATMFHQPEEIHFHGCLVAEDIAPWHWRWCLSRTIVGEKIRWKRLEC